MKERKLTLQVIVDQESTDWHWLFDSMKAGSPEFVNGVCVRGSSNGWVLTEEMTEALIWAHNTALKSEGDW